MNEMNGTNEKCYYHSIFLEAENKAAVRKNSNFVLLTVHFLRPQYAHILPFPYQYEKRVREKEKWEKKNSACCRVGVATRKRESNEKKIKKFKKCVKRQQKQGEKNDLSYIINIHKLIVFTAHSRTKQRTREMNKRQCTSCGVAAKSK